MSLIADSLKKIEKGENEQPERGKDFVAPPLMQKNFGGGSNKGMPPINKGGKKNSKFYLILLLGVIVIVGGVGTFLYMTGGLETLLLPDRNSLANQLPIARTERATTGTEEAFDTGTPQVVIPQEDAVNTVIITETTPTDAITTEVIVTDSGASIPPTDIINIETPEATGLKVELAEQPKAPVAPTPEVVAKVEPVTPAVEDKPKVETTAKKPKTEKQATEKVAETKPAVQPKKETKNKNQQTAFVPKTEPKKPTVKPTIVKPTPTMPTVTKKPVTGNSKMIYTSLISQGEIAIDKRDYRKAIELYTEASKIDSSVMLLGNIAALHIKQGKPAMASEVAIVNKIKDPAIISSLIIDMSSNKYFVQGLVLIKYAKDNLPVNSQIVYAEGYYYEAQKGYLRAAEFYQRAFDINPREVGYLYSYARCLDLSENYYKALESYIRVAALKPEPQLQSVVDQRIRSLQNYLK